MATATGAEGFAATVRNHFALLGRGLTRSSTFAMEVPNPSQFPLQTQLLFSQVAKVNGRA